MLSVTAEYALRALTHMAQGSSTPSRPRTGPDVDPGAGSAILGRELAEKTRIPANYLSKILLSLRNAGIVATARGSGGGYWLVRPPGSIRLIEIVALFDGPARHSCLLGINQQCDDSNPCSAHAYWRDVRQHYECFLESTTLADIARGQAPRPRRGGVRRVHATGSPSHPGFGRDGAAGGRP